MVTRLHTAVLPENTHAPFTDLSDVAETASSALPEERRAAWAAVFDQAPNATAVLDSHGRYLYVNPAFCSLLDCSAPALLRHSPDGSGHGGHAVVLRELLENALAHGHDAAEVKYTRNDGKVCLIDLSYSAINYTAEDPRYVLLQATDDRRGHDVRRQKEFTEPACGRQMSARIYHLALHDPLTGLANRTLLAESLDRHLAALDHGAGVLALLVVDLDEMKQINDRYGHIAGDELLMAAARRISASVPTSTTVARLGGDEFVVAGIVDDSAAAEALRDRVAGSLDTEIVAAGHAVGLKASVGLAITGDPAMAREELLHRADQDMYTRKKRPRTIPARGAGCTGI